MFTSEADEAIGAHPRESVSGGSITDSGGWLRSVNLTAGLLGVGVFLRLVVFFDNRSFWTDEAQLALNLCDRSFADLLFRLDYCQAAPLGFLLIEKMMLQCFGNSECTLRAMPLFAGILSLFFFWTLAQRVLSPIAVPLAVGLFAISEPLLRYCSELKPYSCDVLVSIMIWLAGNDILHNPTRKRGLLVLAVAAVFVPWFSYASIIVLVGVLLTGLCSHFRARTRRSLHSLLAISSLFGLSIWLVFNTSLRNLLNTPCKDSLMDLRAVVPHDPMAFVWMLKKTCELLQYPFGLSVVGVSVGFLCLLAGTINLGSRRKYFAYMLLLPFLFALLGSWLSVYPFFGRFLLFLIPAFHLLVADGANRLSRPLYLFSPALALVALFCLVLPRFDWIKVSGNSLSVGSTNVRSVVKRVASERQLADKIYIYYGAYFPALYYAKRYGISESDLVVGVPGYWWNEDLRNTLLEKWKRSHRNLTAPPASTFIAYDRGDFSEQWALFERDILSLKNSGRVWLIFSHSLWLGSDEERLFLYFLDKHGQKLEKLQESGASAYLYRL